MSSPVVYYLCQMPSAAVSLVASLAIVLMIQFSRKKLSTPYRRLIFGVSISDMCQSIGILTGPFSIPTSTPYAPWAVGNIQSCEANGFMVVMGSNSVPLYTTALCTYYYCKLNKKMTDSYYCRKFEKKIHFLIISYVLTYTITALARGNINPIPGGGLCHIAVSPLQCRTYPEIVGECSRGLDTISFLTINFIVNGICMAAIITSMVLVVRNAFSVENLFRSRGSFQRSEESASSTFTAKARDILCCVPCKSRELEEGETNADLVLRQNARETLIQAVLYVCAFLLSYAFQIILSTFNLAGVSYSVAFSIIISILYPLGGLFNILIYTRPKVDQLRISHTNLSWLRAFLLVIKAGNEVPETRNNPDALNLCCFDCGCPNDTLILDNESVTDHPDREKYWRNIFNIRLMSMSTRGNVNESEKISST